MQLFEGLSSNVKIAKKGGIRMTINDIILLSGVDLQLTILQNTIRAYYFNAEEEIDPTLADRLEQVKSLASKAQALSNKILIRENHAKRN